MAQQRKVSRALESFKTKQYANLASELQRVTGKMKRDRASVRLEQEEDKKLTPSQVLREMKAREEIQSRQESEADRISKGMTIKEYGDYQDSLKGGGDAAKIALARDKKLEADLAEAEKGAIKKREKEQKLESSRRVIEERERRIAEGEGFLPHLIDGKYSKTKTQYSEASDITIIRDSKDAPSREETGAYFTLDDINYMIENNEFEKAKLFEIPVDPEKPDGAKISWMDLLGIDPVTGVAEEIKLEDVQRLMFEYLRTPHGKGLEAGQRMEFKETPEFKTVGINLDLESLFGPQVEPKGPE